MAPSPTKTPDDGDDDKGRRSTQRSVIHSLAGSENSFEVTGVIEPADEVTGDQLENSFEVTDRGVLDQLESEQNDPSLQSGRRKNSK